MNARESTPSPRSLPSSWMSRILQAVLPKRLVGRAIAPAAKAGVFHFFSAAHCLLPTVHRSLVAAFPKHSVGPAVVWTKAGVFLFFTVVCHLSSVVGLFAAPVPANKPPAYPAWWFDREVIKRTNPSNENPIWPTTGTPSADYLSSDDFAVLNQGQLKHLATKAAAELNARLPGGAGTGINDLIISWSTTTTAADNYAVVNQGQLKHIANLFYDRLIAVYYCSDYPWTATTTDDDSFAVANLGQAKFLFSFDLSVSEGQLSDWWQKFYFGQAGVDPSEDFDNDGYSNLIEYQSGSNPINYYSRPSGNLNLSPVVELIGESTLQPGQSTLTLEAAAQDPDNGPAGLTYLWSTVSGPGAVTFSDSNQLQTNIQFSQTGTYVLKFEVSDGEASSAALTVVNVLASTQTVPTVQFTAPASGSQLEQNHEFVLWVKAGDTNSNITTVKLYRNGVLLETKTGNINNDSYLFNWTDAALGAVTFTAVATNTQGGSSAASISLAFYPDSVGAPPVLPNPGNPGSPPFVPGSMKSLPLPAFGPLGLPEQFNVITLEQIEVSDEQEYTGESGQVALVEVVIYSQEYPEYTGENSQYDDVVSWTISPSWGGAKSDTNRVNSLHNKFATSPDNGALVGYFMVKFPTDPNPANRKLKFNATVQNISDGILDTYVSFRMVPIEIEKVWSDQFPNRENINFFTKETSSTGERHYILMADRDDGNAWIKVRLNSAINVTGIRENLLVFLADEAQRPRRPIGVSSEIDVNSEVTIQLGSSNAEDHIVILGYDVNGDGVLQASEVIKESRYKIKITEAFTYGVEVAQLVLGSSAPGCGGDFLRAFVDDLPVEGNNTANLVQIQINSPSLAHNVGVLFGENGSGPIRNNYFNSQNQMAENIRNSRELNRVIRTRILGAGPLLSQVPEYFNTHPEAMDHTFNASYNDIIAYGIDPIADDPNLFLAFGRASINFNLTFKVRRSDGAVTEVAITGGTQSDLYDWDYQINPGQARVQAGYNSLGSAGHIFSSTVDITGSIPGLSFNYTITNQ